MADLGEPYTHIEADARELARKLEPLAQEADERSSVHPGVLAALQESGAMRFTVPARFGGAFDDIDPTAVCVVREVLMGTCAAADALFALQGIGSYPITIAGRPDQQSEWLPRVASGEVLAALALSEPEAGSDLKGIKTTARESRGAIELNGQKSFISNAGAAGFYTLLAREEDELSAFLVPADAEGLTYADSPRLAAPHVIGELHLDAVRLDAGSRLGKAGDGLNIVLSTLAVFRVSVGAAAVGLAQTALEEAVRHARTRHQFGRPLAQLGPVAALLADSWADVASTRLLTYEAARRARHDALGSLEYSSLAKLAATEACARVVDRCVQVMGRWGLIHGSRIERCYRQARPMRIYEGTSEVLRLGIARRLTEEIS